MYQLTGEFECKLDAKGRVRLPANLVRQLSGSGAYEFMVNRGFENHLMLYPKDVWDEKTKELNQLNIYIKKNRQAVRYFYRGATAITADASDRILIPKSLIEYAGIDKEVVLFAYQDMVEIWSKEAYELTISEEPDSFSELAEEVFGGGNQGSDNE
ncbi:MAG: division/cell wall cluster transcriptional repressor MraZ [Bacteroidia bacterium]|nr:division/cell wall cluster transcriptional repressor MraZ [Bacteroidia bacterium]NNK90078.1 division/cell wall cluster transcriptional repressor MraZ [Saprospiraceae bacterium]